MNILVIPDAHVHPDYDNSRFTLLGRLLLDLRPDIIVNIGDFADMPSLSSYDKGMKSFEGRRYKRDCEAVIDAQEKLFACVKEYNAAQRRSKRKQYKPKKVITLGNHEAGRINRVTESHPEFESIISINDLQYNKFGWKVVNYKDSIEIGGVWFSHYFSSGVMGRPIGGEHVAHSLITKGHVSCVQGHSHLLDYSVRTKPNGDRVQGLVCGCYVHEDYIEPWCSNTRHLWWNGVCLLNNVSNGEYDLSLLTYNTIKRKYG